MKKINNNSTYQKTILENGIRVVSEYISYVRSVSIGVWVDVGSRDETPNSNGISHFIEHMVFKGTKKRSAKDIAQSLESVGGYLNAFTSKEHTCFYARILDEYVERTVDVLSDLLINPLFNPREIAKEKLVILEELKNYEDEPDELIHDKFEHTLFSPHALGNSILGTNSTIKKFDRKKTLEYKNRHYVGSNIVIAAAGNIKHDELVRLARKYFRDVKKSSEIYIRPDAKKISFGVEIQVPKPIHQAHLCMGTYTYNVKDPKRYPLLILNTFLGDGMSSRLYQTIREKYGLAYSVYSFANLMSDIGFFGIYVGTDKEKIDKSLHIIELELNKLKKNPLTKDEISRTKSQVKGGMVLGLENMSNRMMRLGRSDLYYNDYFSLDSIMKKIDAVKAEDILEVANEIMNFDKFAKIRFVPKN